MKRLLKYLSLFFLTVFGLFLLQALVVRIPNELIKDNIVKSIDYYERLDIYLFPSLMDSRNYYFKNSLKLDERTDAVTLSMLWNVNNNRTNLWKSQITMDFFYNSTGGPAYYLRENILSNPSMNMEYSRYWHGSIIYVKPLLIFFDVFQIKIINAVLLSILTIYFIYLLLKKSKRLTIAFLIGLISINYFVVPFCIEYFFIFLLLIIISIITIKIYDKDDKHFYYLMLLSGALSCFFDFLTCETLTISIPLLLNIYLSKKKRENTRENWYFIIKSSIIWLLSYAMTYVCKWILAIIVLGPLQLANIFESASARIYNITVNGNLFIKILNMIISMFCHLFPISLFNQLAPLVLLIIVIIVIMTYFLLLRKSQREHYMFLVLVSLIGILRLLVLYAHSFQHDFFDYRALMPMVITACLIVLGGVKNEVNYFNSMSKRRDNVRRSNKSSKEISKKKKTR